MADGLPAGAGSAIPGRWPASPTTMHTAQENLAQLADAMDQALADGDAEAFCGLADRRAVLLQDLSRQPGAVPLLPVLENARVQDESWMEVIQRKMVELRERINAVRGRRVNLHTLAIGYRHAPGKGQYLVRHG